MSGELHSLLLLPSEMKKAGIPSTKTTIPAAGAGHSGPGSRGGKFFYNKHGKIQYGEPPAGHKVVDVPEEEHNKLASHARGHASMSHEPLSPAQIMMIEGHPQMTDVQFWEYDPSASVMRFHADFGEVFDSQGEEHRIVRDAEFPVVHSDQEGQPSTLQAPPEIYARAKAEMDRQMAAHDEKMRQYQAKEQQRMQSDPAQRSLEEEAARIAIEAHKTGKPSEWVDQQINQLKQQRGVKALPPHLASLSKAELESMCVDCGICCFAQVELVKGHKVLIPELRCQYLVYEPEGKTCCSIYNERETKAKSWCLPLAEAIAKGLFPKPCPYVAEMEDYVGTHVLNEDQYDQLRPRLQKAFDPRQKPVWITHKAWALFVNGRDYLEKSGWREDLADATEEADDE